jgi:hypothetical protein
MSKIAARLRVCLLEPVISTGHVYKIGVEETTTTLSNRARVVVLSVAMAAALTACATEYGPSTWKGGYKDAHIRDNIYYVEFSANAWVDSVTAIQYFERRAKEVCEENGYSDYKVSQQRDVTAYQAVVGSGGGTTLQKPGFSGYVECLQ